MTDSTTLVLGLGVAGQAVLEALVHRGVKALAVDDAPGDAAQRCAERLGVSLVTVSYTHLTLPTILLV